MTEERAQAEECQLCHQMVNMVNMVNMAIVKQINYFHFALKVDKYQSIHDKFKNNKLKSKSSCLTRTLHNLRIKCASLRTKMRNKTDDLHKKVSKDLCSKFKNIFLPLFDTKKWLKCYQNNIVIYHVIRSKKCQDCHMDNLENLLFEKQK